MRTEIRKKFSVVYVHQLVRLTSFLLDLLTGLNFYALITMCLCWPLYLFTAMMAVSLARNLGSPIMPSYAVAVDNGRPVCMAAMLSSSLPSCGGRGRRTRVSGVKDMAAIAATSRPLLDNGRVLEGISTALSSISAVFVRLPGVEPECTIDFLRAANSTWAVCAT